MNYKKWNKSPKSKEVLLPKGNNTNIKYNVQKVMKKRSLNYYGKACW